MYHYKFIYIVKFVFSLAKDRSQPCQPLSRWAIYLITRSTSDSVALNLATSLVSQSLFDTDQYSYQMSCGCYLYLLLATWPLHLLGDHIQSNLCFGGQGQQALALKARLTIHQFAYFADQSYNDSTNWFVVSAEELQLNVVLACPVHWLVESRCLTLESVLYVLPLSHFAFISRVELRYPHAIEDSLALSLVCRWPSSRNLSVYHASGWEARPSLLMRSLMSRFPWLGSEGPASPIKS